MIQNKNKNAWEFGDFQTPENLALEATKIVKKLGIEPRSVLEPTCGRGAFLLASCQVFPHSSKFIGVDINTEHLSYLKDQVIKKNYPTQIDLINADFFSLDWSEIIQTLAEPLLIIGNPPWITSSEQGLLKSSNLPQKSNFQKKSGYDALTGKSNFDISEWILLKHLEWLKGRTGIIAILCKTSVARKILTHIWRYKYNVICAQMYNIETLKHFNTSVDACLFILQIGDEALSISCDIFDNLSASKPSKTISYYEETIISNIKNYQDWSNLRGISSAYSWRSGLKHDCSKVMELVLEGNKYRNGYGATYYLEPDYIYPCLKSSDISNMRTYSCRKYVIVTQQYIGEDTTYLKSNAPKIWYYLEKYREDLSKRSSSIYRNRPEFSIFGVGKYTFTPWKVAISGFYKTLNFVVVGPIENQPVIFDDTVYFLPCWSKSEADFIAAMLNSQPAKEFLESMIFWNDKRPITIELLKRLNLSVLAQILDREEEYNSYAKNYLKLTG